MAQFKPRAAERRRCYFATRFIFNGGFASLDAIARNISPLGARIESDDASVVPPEFDLLIRDPSGHGGMRRARRIWRSDRAMGVAFIAAA